MFQGCCFPTNGRRDDSPVLQRQAEAGRLEADVAGRQVEVRVQGTDLQHHQRIENEVLHFLVLLNKTYPTDIKTIV